MELKKIDNIKKLKENPFVVPDGYFENLEREVATKIKSGSVFTIFRGRYFAITSAAAALVLIFGTISLMRFSKNERDTADINTNVTYETTDNPQSTVTRLSNDQIIEFLEHDGIDVVTMSLID